MTSLFLLFPKLFVAIGEGVAAKTVTCTLDTSHYFFFMPPWWEYIKDGTYDALGECSVNVNFPDDIWAIALAGLDILLRLAGFVAVISIIVAGIMYIAASGNPEKAAAARTRIYNALIGLVIAVVAASVVSFVGHRLG